MREAYKRCTHCQTVYLCLLSGHSPRTKHTDDRFCPDCLEVVRAALREVPRKFEKTRVPATDVTLDQLLAWEQETETEAAAKGGLQARRVAFPLFDLTGKKKHHTAFVKGRGQGFTRRTFLYSYWTTEGVIDMNDVTIEEEVERNLETGQTRPWGLHGV